MKLRKDLERAWKAQNRVERRQAQLTEALKERQQAFGAAREAGMLPKELGRLTGLSPARVSRIIRDGRNDD